jgi:hypothetical protein
MYKQGGTVEVMLVIQELMWLAESSVKQVLLPTGCIHVKPVNLQPSSTQGQCTADHVCPHLHKGPH